MTRRWTKLVALMALLTLVLAGQASAHHSTKHGGGGGGKDGGSEPAPEPEPEPNSQDPILFVHGWNSSGSVWTTMIDRFKADGWTDGQLFNWSYDYRQSNKTTAQEVLAKVNDIKAKTGASRVDVISHSMGGLSTRWCVKFTGCDGSLDGWVSLGGPNHGTSSANWCFDTSCREMRVGSAFLTDLNAGDETPGSATRWSTWWSSCDSVIDPSESTILSGATNTKTACLSHSDLYKDATVYAQVRDTISN